MTDETREFLDERKRLAEALVTPLLEKDQLLRELFDAGYFDASLGFVVPFDKGAVALFRRLRAAVGE